MADISHLERMGRELKCPICLSLLNSAISLSCNHVFCNLCIWKSMKSAAHCPVCKVPFQRREIRPAPHMDNLVSIYKSMEVASGVDIFVTQNGLPAKLGGAEDQIGGNNMCGLQEQAETVIEGLGSAGRKKAKRKELHKSKISRLPKSCPDSGKPSFPRKKRVQVPQHPAAEISTHQLAEVRTTEHTVCEPQKSSSSEKQKPMFSNEGKPGLSPFYWLRDEEDDENVSPHMDEDHVLETPPDIPCFSDLKDEDDIVTQQMTPKSVNCINQKDAELLDSEMFEWTQRACSPELVSSPIKLQVSKSEKCSGVQERTQSGSLPHKTRLTSGGRSSRNLVNENATTEPKTNSPSCSPYKFSENEEGLTKSVKRLSKRYKHCQKEEARRTLEASEVNVDSTEVDQYNKQDGEAEKHQGSLQKGTTKKTRKVGMKSSASSVSAEKIKRNVEKEKLKTANQEEVLVSMPTNKSFCTEDDKAVTSLGLGKKKNEADCERQNGLKRVKFCENKVSKDKKSVESKHGGDEVDGGKTQINQMAERDPDSGEKDQLKKDEPVINLNNLGLRKCDSSPIKVKCAFCQCAEDSEVSGSMVHYLKGKPVSEVQGPGLHVIHAHRNCVEWAPNVYFDDDTVINLEKEVRRSRRISCILCGVKGAALGCYKQTCRRSFHFTCAKWTPDCRWDNENFVMLCPLHNSCQLPSEEQVSNSKQRKKSTHNRHSAIHQPQSLLPTDGPNLLWKSQKSSKNLVICCSALNHVEKGIVSEFERLSGIAVSRSWDSSVTHVIAATDENKACRRTLKFLMGVLEGKWVLSVEWIKACMDALDIVHEQPYEIGADVHGIRDGPRLGRLRVLNKQPKLFNGYKFYFMGDFSPSYKGYLRDLVVAGGGIFLNRKPVPEDPGTLSYESRAERTFIIYSTEDTHECEASKRSSIIQCRCKDAHALAKSTGAIVASNSWILDSIAGSMLQSLTRY